MASHKSILCISDLHIPFEHPDSFEYLKAIKQKYKPETIVNLGDEVSLNAFSFHDKDGSELFTPTTELEECIERLQPYYKLFPKKMLCESNHGSLILRKAKFAKIPLHLLMSYQQILQSPKTWTWHNKIILDLPRGQKVLFTHGKAANTPKLSKNNGVNTVEGHYHTRCELVYWKGELDPNPMFGMKVGCSIDNSAYDFNYNKTNVDDVIVNHAVIINGFPKLLPMPMNKKNRWNGEVP